MNILALNTSFSNSDVAIKFGEERKFVSLDSNAKHSENILVCVDDLLSKNNHKIQDIECVGVVVGPGSFTGIRIGVGLVKGMYLAKSDIKLVSICSLDLMAHIFVKNGNKEEFWCVLDALSGNIFVCKYDCLGNRLTEPEMLNVENINKVNGVVVGLESETISLCNNFVQFSAENLLSFVETKENVGEFVNENELLPLYLRKSQAEVGLENGNKKDN